MFAPYRSLSGRYWRRRPARALLVLAGIALGAATWVATATLARSLDRAGRQAATPLAGTAGLHVGNGDAGVRADLAAALSHVPGVRAIRPLVIQRVTLPDLGGRSVLLLGVDLPAAGQGGPEWDVQVEERPPSYSLRDLFLARKPALLGRELDRALPAGAGQVTVRAAGREHRLLRAGTLTAQGPAAALGGQVLVLRCEDAAELFGPGDRVSRLDVSLDPGADADAVRRRLVAELHGQAHVWTPEGHDGQVRDMLAGIQVGLVLCGAGTLVLGVFLVYNTLAVAVAERRHEIGVLRSLGATRGQVAALFLGEAAVLGVAGSALGLPLGLGLARLSLGPARQALGDVFVPLPGQPLEVAVGPLLGALAAGAAASLAAGLLPAVQAARERPSDALRRVPPAAGRGPSWRAACAALALAVLGLTIAALRDRLPPRVGSCGGLVLLVLAAVTATPLVADLLARLLRPLAARLPGVAARLALDNLRRAPGRTGLVVAALAAGIGLLLQTAGLVLSNEAAVRDWVERSVVGDLFVTSGGPLSASGRTLPLSEDLAEQLRAALPGARTVAMRFRHMDPPDGGQAGRVLVVALDAAAYYDANRERRPPLPDLAFYRDLPAPGVALVSENYAALHGTRPGDTVTLPGLDGPVVLRVLGAVADYSCSRGTVLVDRARYRRPLDAGLIDVLAVYLPPGADLEEARHRLLIAPAAAGCDLCVLTHDELRGHILGMVRRLYGLAYGQEAVVALVALLGVVSSVLISVLQRQRELGLLRAVGATRAQVLHSVLAEALLLGGLGTAVGLLLGWPLEWYTVRVLLFEEAGFVCPVRFPWAVAAGVVALAVAGAAAAGLGPALYATRRNAAAVVAEE